MHLQRITACKTSKGKEQQADTMGVMGVPLGSVGIMASDLKLLNISRHLCRQHPGILPAMHAVHFQLWHAHCWDPACCPTTQQSQHGPFDWVAITTSGSGHICLLTMHTDSCSCTRATLNYILLNCTYAFLLLLNAECCRRFNNLDCWQAPYRPWSPAAAAAPTAPAPATAATRVPTWLQK